MPRFWELGFCASLRVCLQVERQHELEVNWCNRIFGCRISMNHAIR